MDAKERCFPISRCFPKRARTYCAKRATSAPGYRRGGVFFSDEAHARHLSERLYNREEAEAYFLARGAEYFKRGLPFRDRKDFLSGRQFRVSANPDRRPLAGLYIFADSGAAGVDVNAKSFRATLDGLPVKNRLRYEEYLPCRVRPEPPSGKSRLRFSFENNARAEKPRVSRIVQRARRKGRLRAALKEGTRLISSHRTAREGVLMLRAALSMGTTDPAAAELLWKLARACELIGERSQAWYLYARLYYFYPDSPYRKKLSGKFSGHRYPVEFLGKKVKVEFDPGLDVKGENAAGKNR
jgi:hypothetical protein